MGSRHMRHIRRKELLNILSIESLQNVILSRMSNKWIEQICFMHKNNFYLKFSESS